MPIYTAMEQLIGKTPLVRLCRLEEKLGLCASVLAKLEYRNPAGSVKDRVAMEMLDDAERKGLIAPGATIIEPTSGNTGIGLCAICAQRGYEAVIVMPDTMSIERIQTMKAYGASVVLTDGKLGMTGAIAKANEIKSQTPNSFIPGQFDNPANPLAHYKTTGREIWEDTEGKIDIFVCGIGTGGTISGVGRYLKEKNPEICIVGIEPSDSAVLSGGKAGPHALQGIGAGFVPGALDTEIYDEIITVSGDDAYEYGRMIGRCEGILVGISSGAAICAAAAVARRAENNGKNIVVLLPDGGDKYLSTPMYRL